MCRAIWAVVLGCATVVLAVTSGAGHAGDALVRDHGDARLQWGPCPPVFPAGCEVAVLHGDPAENHADVFFRVPAGYELPSHRHTSAEHMILVAGELRVTYQGQAPLTMRAGSYAFGPAKVPHAGRCTSAVPCVLFIAFESPVDAEAVAGQPAS